MANKPGKRAGAKLTLVLLSVFLFLLLVAPPVFAATFGDINDDGDIDVLDVVLVMKHVLKIDLLTATQEAVADVNGDGDIDVQDVTLIMQKSLGLINEFPSRAVEVLSVSAINLKEVEVKFNQPMDPLSAQNPANYVFSGFAAANLNAPAVFAQFTDSTNTTVRLVTAGVAAADKMATTDTAAKLAITEVWNQARSESYSSPAAKEALGTIAADNTHPALEALIPLGTNHFMVRYSEAVIGAVSTADHSALKEAAYKVGSTQLTAVATPATGVVITNPSGDLRNYLFTFTDAATSIVPMIGSKTIWVNNHTEAGNRVRDYGGNVVPISSESATFVQDLTRPTVEKVEMLDRQTARVTFSEFVKTPPAAINLIKWGTDTYATATKPASAMVYRFGTTYDITFTTANAMPASGLFKLFIPKEQVVDYSGNRMLADYVATLTGAASAPMQITAAGTTAAVVITFSRAHANDATITTAANYKIDGAALPASAAITKTSTTVTITTTLTHGSHTVTISGLKDAFGVTIPDLTASFSVVDTAAPTVTERLGWNDATTTNGANRDLILVTFNKVMNATSLTTAGNYRIEYFGAGVAVLPSGTVLTTLAGNKAVLIDMPSQGVLTTGAKLHVGRISGGTVYGVTDLAGNTLAPSGWEVQPSALLTAGLDINVNTPSGLAANNPVVSVHNKVTLRVNASNLNMLGKAAAADFTVTRDSVAVTVQSATVKDVSGDGFYDTVELSFADNTFTAGSVVNVAVASALTTTDRFGVALQAKNKNAVNIIPAQLQGAAVQGITNLKVLYVTTDYPMEVAQDGNMKNSLQIRENGTLRSINTVTQVSSRRFRVTMVSDLDLTAEILVRTLPQASVTVVDDRDEFLAANTTGIRADKLAAINVELVNLNAGDLLQNASTLTIEFNKNIAPASIKTGWTGTAGEAVAVTANATTDTLTIAGVGVVHVDSITTGGTMGAATMVYSNANRTLTVTFTTIAPIVSGDIDTGLVFVPDAGIKDLDSEAINRDFRFVQ